MGRINNVNVKILEEVTRAREADPAKARRAQRVEGEWLLEEDAPQFRMEATFEGGKMVLESDQPKNLGGGGTRPGPMHYCFFGLASCYTSTFATVASMMGIELKRLSVKLEGDLNFSKVYGLSDDPVIEGVRITLLAESDAPKERLMEVEKIALERCPAVFALTTPVKLDTTLEVL